MIRANREIYDNYINKNTFCLNMFELNLFSPKVQEILMKKPLLLTHLKK